VIFSVIPTQYQRQAQDLLTHIIEKIGAYVRGQLVLMTAVGLVVWLGLFLMGIPNAPVLGLIAFALEIVPILGPILSAAFGILVALGESPMLALWVGLFYLLVQQTESYFLTPKIFGKSVELHPFWIFLTILMGGSLAGLPGIVLAIPLTVIIRLLIQELYIKKLTATSL
jgi:predicted PurR-regulated permease PerM